MFYAYVKYKALKGQNSFQYGFPTITTKEVKVTKDGVDMRMGHDYEIPNEGIVYFFNDLQGDEAVIIRRVTDIGNRLVNFSNTALLTETELDSSAIQMFHALQEQADRITLLGG